MKPVQEILEKGVEGCDSCKVGSALFQQTECPGKRMKLWLVDLLENLKKKNNTHE